jgi:hypothetical protein
MSPSHDSPNPENNVINPYEFPVGYFDAQVRFAKKWSEVTGEGFADVIEAKTAIARRLGGPESLHETLSGIDQSADPTSITASLYDRYLEQPDSLHADPEDETAFGYDYHPDTKTVKIHFTNPRRGEKPLSDENMPKREADFRALLEHVRENHPEAALLMSATWLRSTRHYRDLSPPDIDEQRDLMSPDMKLAGNSVWGQFIDASGHTNQRVYDQFVAALETATTKEELIAAFPLKTLMAVDPIDKYFDHYQVERPSTSAE